MYSVSSVDYLFHTDSHGGMSASERGGYCLSSELIRNLDGGSLGCSVSTALIIYPQMSDRCYTDFHLFQICLTSVDCIGPQADGDVVRNCHEYPAMFINIFTN